MSDQTITVRVVRCVSQVRPRWLTAKDVMDSCPDDNGAVVYATLSAQSKDSAKGPLARRRSEGGVLEYTTIAGFDFDRWVAGKAAPRRAIAAVAKDSKAALDDPEVQIVKSLLAAKRRLTSDEIYGCGDYGSKEALLVRLAAMVKPDMGVLERDREAVGKPWVYRVKPDIDIDGWLKERGATAPVSTPDAPALAAVTGLTQFNAQTAQKTATPPTGQRVPPQDARTASVAAPNDGGRAPSAPVGEKAAGRVEAAEQKTAAPQAAATPEETSKPEGRDRAGSTSPPATAAATESSPATSDHISQPGKKVAAEPFDLMTELTIVAALNLAAAVRACDRPGITSALRNFDHADALREQTKAVRA